MAKILALDTATVACSVALLNEGDLTERLEIAPRRHNELLLPMVDGLLKSSSLTIYDCDAIAFSAGPGSFIGLRIAAGVAQSLAFAVGLPVIPVSTLHALAQNAYWQASAQSILVGWDARMGQIYWGLYQANQSQLSPVVSDRVSLPSAVDCSINPCLAAGNAWTVYQKYLPHRVAAVPRLHEDCYPTAKAVAFLALNAFKKGEGVRPENVSLFYLRNKVAEKSVR